MSNNAKTSLKMLFHRPDSHNPAIDGVRALAIIIVVIGHVFTVQTPLLDIELPSWLRHDLGVDMFFVISGFLIGTILFKDYDRNGSIRFSNFYVRRFLRLMPVYMVVLLAGLYFMNNWYDIQPEGGFPKVGDNALLGDSSNAENIWTNILYVNNYVRSDKQYMLWCWSLAIEEQFYILAPAFLLLVLTFAKRRMLVFSVMLLLSVLMRVLVIYQYDLIPEHAYNANVSDPQGVNYLVISFSVLYDNLITRYGGLLIGIMGAYLVNYHQEKLKQFINKRISFVLMVLSLVYFFGAFVELDFFYFGRLKDWATVQVNSLEKGYWAFTLGMFRNLFAAATMFIILFALYSNSRPGRLVDRFLSFKWFYPVAQLSYSAYMTHYMFMCWMYPSTTPYLQQHIDSAGLIHFINGVLGVLLTILVSIVLYVYVERPCMEYRRSDRIKRLISFFERKPKQLSG